MSSDAPAIRVARLSKSYAMYRRPEHRLLQSLVGQRRRLYRESHALRDVSFDVQRGETVGILGRNGSGKSTLLQLIAGTLTPTSGQVEVRGRTSAILELGAGFNAEFTGRENLVVSAAVAGLTADESVSRVAAMARFADLGPYIDQPVRTYSSGMYARLAFAVAIHVDPEVLIVDEALAVGDARFQAQCFRKFEEFKRRGVTILFVSHSIDQVARHCTRALLLEQGSLVMSGEPRPVIARYLEILFGPGAVTPAAGAAETPAAPTGARDEALAEPSKTERIVRAHFGDDAMEERFAARPAYNHLEHRWGDGRARIVDYALCRRDGEPCATLETGDPATLFIRVRFVAPVGRPIYGFTIKTPDGVEITGNNSRDGAASLASFAARAPGDDVIVRFDFTCHLNAGDYLLSVGVADDGGDAVLPVDRRYDSILLTVRNARKSFGVVDLGIRAQELAPIAALDPSPT